VSFLERWRPAAPREPLELVLYTRAGCHLCEVMKQEIEDAHLPVPYVLREVDVDSDPALAERHGRSVPVLAIEGRVAFKARLARAQLIAKVERAAARRR
jgi:hypothetical protein